MKQTILILTFVLTTFLCFGQKPHLKPARNFKQYEGELKAYYDSVFPILYKGYAEKPEPLKYKYSGFWSLRIDNEHRLIYQVRDDEILIAKCRFHYD